MPLRVNGIEFEELTADPGSPVEGQVWYNTSDNEYRIFRNGATRTIIYQLTLDTHIAAANPHTVTLEQARTAGNTLAGPIDMGGFKITNLGDASAGTDVPTFAQVTDQINSKLRGWDWQESILDRDLNTPPGSPGVGDRYLVASGGTGDWAGQDDAIAEWDGSAWVFSPPDEGFATRVEDENLLIIYDGAAWGSFGSAVDHGNLIGLGDDDHTQYLLVSGSRSMSGNLDMGTNNITNVGTVDGVDVSGHAARHIDGGADPIDADQLEITWIPANYTRTTSPAEVSQLDQLTAHLAGIDAELASAALDQKAGRVLNASFTGNPKKATVTFASAFPSANYAVNVTAVTINNTTYAPAVESQVAGSFVINMGANNIANLTQVNWIAMVDGEST